MTREITHMKAFMAALESMGKDPLEIGKIPPTPGLVDQFFNDSTGEGDDGEIDARGPWNEGGKWKIVEKPELEQGVKNFEGSNGRDTGPAQGSRRKRLQKAEIQEKISLMQVNALGRLCISFGRQDDISWAVWGALS